jgi:hypothetical protein
MFESTELLFIWIFCTWLIASVFIGIHDVLVKSNKELADKLARHLDTIIHRVRVEKDRNVYYWYDTDNNKFLAQGASDEELINNLKSRFPTHMFFLPTNHLVSAKTDWQPKNIKQ